jgi:hypothetical protein
MVNYCFKNGSQNMDIYGNWRGEDRGGKEVRGLGRKGMVKPHLKRWGLFVML